MAETVKLAAGPKCAMVLAAGLGTRMRAFNQRVPKPLVQVCGKALLDYVLDQLAEQGVECAVVNVHHLAEQIERHLAPRQRPRIIISDERGELLGTAGGVIKAFPQLGHDPFFHVNSDTIWIDTAKPNLAALAEAFDYRHMDALLLVADIGSSIGYAGLGDFTMASDGRLTRRREGERTPFVYAGAAILTREFFSGVPIGPSSMSPLFDQAAQAGRLWGVPLEGVWMHVGTPEAVKAAETAMLAGAV
jgi:N-acetyl-alpha-D-muramate 1-phosphate uridylyltransferase